MPIDVAFKLVNGTKGIPQRIWCGSMSMSQTYSLTQALDNEFYLTSVYCVGGARPKIYYSTTGSPAMPRNNRGLWSEKVGNHWPVDIAIAYRIHLLCQVFKVPFLHLVF